MTPTPPKETARRAKHPAASAAPPAVETMPVEACFEELETIVAALESSGTALDESLRLFERGMALSRRCSSELDRVEKRIQMIVKGPDGKPTAVPFDAEDDEEGGDGYDGNG